MTQEMKDSIDSEKSEIKNFLNKLKQGDCTDGKKIIPEVYCVNKKENGEPDLDVLGAGDMWLYYISISFHYNKYFYSMFLNRSKYDDRMRVLYSNTCGNPKDCKRMLEEVGGFANVELDPRGHPE